jgi:hypothetical protein
MCSDKPLLIVTHISDISVFKSQDGTCIVSSQAAKTNLRSASRDTDGDSSENMWIWKRLCIMDAGEVRTTSTGYVSSVHRHSPPLACTYTT